ncbi:hypothetical protein [Nitrosospira sp. Nsp1]|uniref:hypothetical protein n=1 Tax=Nitrosospira sp. Nsp1 TaxID=136547 RepID=UPI00088A7EC0|nr:hypothetical protein [Nitrosospira sp. Nsp1]SCX41887.1 hypothetical protein SAMN05720354_1041 [Nitrosospira sp. Nsp1]
MKTAKLLLLSLVTTVGFSFPAAWAGEPNTALLGNEQSQVKSDNGNSKATQGRDCPPEISHEKDAQHTGIQQSEGQHGGVLKE